MRRFGLILAVIVAIAVATWWWMHREPPARTVTRPEIATLAHPAPPPPDRSSKLAALAREIPPDQISPIARDLDAPGGTIRHDLEILNEVFVAWQSNFPHDGNPVGENDEITSALAGDNRLHFAFIAPNHPAINDRGEICDRWGVPFRFHQLSGTQMEIRSAGPDRKFGTPDDVEFAPWPKQQ